MFIFPLLLLQTTLLSKHIFLFYIIVIPFIGACLFYLNQQFKKYINYTVGARAEQSVGAVLNQLWGEQCSVFHDVDIIKSGKVIANIDHVIVSPSGVFVIETKYRRKTTSAEGHKIKFDGKGIHFPNNVYTKDPVNQALNNSNWLSQKLSKATGELTKCTAILTYPGWWIDQTGHGDIHVLNPKRIKQIVTAKSNALFAKDRITRINHQLEQLSCIDLNNS